MEQQGFATEARSAQLWLDPAPWHLSPMERADQEGRRQCRYRGVVVYDDAAQRTHQHDQSRTQPVLLTEEAKFATWLNGTPEEALGLITTSDAERMRIVQSGFDKNDLLEAA
jgi:hypothetical protein